jgi:HTH-type transcriptional regulator/antitoxin MqsA
MISAESGRPMTRGEKLVTFKLQGHIYSYKQPGWWCSLTDPEDTEGQLVDGDNQVADMARRTAKALAHGERVFVPVVIRAIRQRCGLTQREAGLIFGTGEKSFEKYESGEIAPSAPTKRLLRLAMEKPELFRAEGRQAGASAIDDSAFVHEALRAAQVERLYGPLFAEPV